MTISCHALRVVPTFVCPANPFVTEQLPDSGGTHHHTTGDQHMTIRQRFATFVLAASVLGAGFVAVDAVNAGAAQLPTAAVAATADSVATSAAEALASVGTPTFAMRLESTADAVAATLEVDAAPLNAAWVAADQLHQIALLSALTQVGVPYHRNTSKPGIGFDCSGLTAFAWGQSGVAMARNSGAQLRNAGSRTRDTAQPGDLVYYPGHVMMWLGVDNLIVHAPQRGHPVEVGHVTERRLRRVRFGDPLG